MLIPYGIRPIRIDRNAPAELRALRRGL